MNFSRIGVIAEGGEEEVEGYYMPQGSLCVFMDEILYLKDERTLLFGKYGREQVRL